MSASVVIRMYIRNIVFKCVLILLIILNGVISQNKNWWTSMQMYQIYPRSFRDSDGDGIGDLKGITEKLEHIKDTGAIAAWLSPIFQSPMYDFGYDISNYKEIAQEYGSMEDFEELVTRAKEMGLKIILDFVPNHTSHLHEWFILSANRIQPFQDFYVWHPGKPDPEDESKLLPPSNWLSAFGGKAWTWHEGRGEYYYHQFLPQQPDLNFRNPLVRDAMKDVLRFWLDRGVAGFRVDAVPHLFEVDSSAFGGNYPDEPISGNTENTEDYGYLNHLYSRDQDELYDLIYDWRILLDEYEGDEKIMMVECMSDTSFVMRYYGNSTADGAHFPFNFALAYLNKPSANDVKRAIDDWLLNIPKGKVSNWVLGNHDQPRIATRFGEDLSEAALMIELLLPGVAVTYQGEEIGMTDQFLSYEDTMDPQSCKKGPENYWRDSRDPERTPFHWNNGLNAGFSTATRTWLPIANNYVNVNLADQIGYNRSHYAIYKSISALRKENTILKGSVTTATFENNVFAYARTLDNEPTFVVVVNFELENVIIDLGAKFDVNDLEVVIASRNSNHFPGEIISPFELSLNPKESLVLKQS